MATDWKHVVKTFKNEPLRDDEMTAAKFSVDTGLAYSQAAKKLNNMVRDGLATKRFLSINGTRTAAYRLTK